MKTLKKGQKVKNYYGDILTVSEIKENMVFCIGSGTSETGLYHITKIYAI